MIHFPEIDFKNKSIRIILFLLVVILFFLNNLGTNALLSILVLFIFINQFSLAKKNIKKNLFEKKENIMLNYNNKIENLLLKIKKYEKFNRIDV